MSHGGWEGDVPPDASNVLLSASAMNPIARDVCAALATRAAEPSDLAMLVITYRDSAEVVLEDLRACLGREPAQVTVVSVGEQQRFGGEFEGGTERRFDALESDAHPDVPTVEAVESPSDLTGLGIVVSERLVEWDQERWTPGPSVLTVCFDSVTALLQHVDERRAYRFLHILTRRIEDTGATGHFHLDPGACDQQTVSLFESLFDASVDVTDDGERSVRHR